MRRSGCKSALWSTNKNWNSIWSMIQNRYSNFKVRVQFQNSCVNFLLQAYNSPGPPPPPLCQGPALAKAPSPRPSAPGPPLLGQGLGRAEVGGPWPREGPPGRRGGRQGEEKVGAKPRPTWKHEATKTVMQIESDDNEGDNDDDSDNGVSTRMHTIKTNELVNSGLFWGLLI